MTDQDKEKIVYRIVYGKERLILNDNKKRQYFWLTTPTPKDKIIANEVYDEVLAESSLQGLMTEEVAFELLKEKKLWSKKDQEEIETAIKNLDNLKVGLYKAHLRRERDLAREGLNRTRKLIQELNIKRNKFSDKTAEWSANIAKTKYLIGKCLLRNDESPVWSSDDFWQDPSSLLDDAFAYYVLSRIEEKQMREIARTEPWRSIWLCRHSEGQIFGKPAGELSDDQKALVAWSRLYDNCYEDNERPSDDVIEDDDRFDGWLISKRREREKEVKKTKVENAIQNEKIANASEVMVLASAPKQISSNLTAEEFQEIEEMNTPDAIRTKKERMKELFDKGEVKEADMPDTKRYIRNTLDSMAKKRNR